MSSENHVQAETKSLLSEDAFKNEQSQKLFEAIDELRSCGANHEIDLPELVIVGDQSAGKSSLLQSLTDIPFPVADRLCTRFPTRIVSRRRPFQPESIRISIEASRTALFDDTSYLDRVQKYAGFSRTLQTFDTKDFTAIFDQVVDLMGISRSEDSTSRSETRTSTERTKSFCSDILKVEISGPNRSYFSILDLPGIFQSLTKALTENEKVGVRHLTTIHMRPKQSIIVCVASGTNDLANQGVFDIASTEDPFGERTVGVITKCDISQHKSQLMDLAQNVEKYFHHGWFVVRNRTPLEAESSLEPRERQLKEQAFFRDVPWNALPEHRRGTQALKKYLAELLCSRIKENFPVMLSTIKNRSNVTQLRLESLGATRKTVDQKRIYLTRLSQVFHLAASQALRGRYEFSTSDSVKLRKLVREANDAFAKELKEHGHTVAFLEIESLQQALNRPTHQVENKNPISTIYDSQVGKEQEELPTYIETTNSVVRLYQDYYSPEEIKLRNYKKNPENLIPSGPKPNLPIAPDKPFSPAPQTTFGQPAFGPTSSFLKPLDVSQTKTPEASGIGSQSAFGSSFSSFLKPLDVSQTKTPEASGIGSQPAFGASSSFLKPGGGPQSQTHEVSSGSFGSLPASSAPSLFTKPLESHHQDSSFGGGSFGSQPLSSASSLLTKSSESHHQNSSFDGGLFDNPPTFSSLLTKPSESHNQNSSFGGGSFVGGSFGSQPVSNAPSLLTKPSESHNKNSAFGGGLFRSQTPPPPSSTFGKALESIKPRPSVNDGLLSSQPPSNEKSSSKGLFQNLGSPKPLRLYQDNENTKSSQIYDWIKSEVKACRGTELQGIMNPDVFPVLFHRQIGKWKSISEAHFLKVSKFSADILVSMLSKVCSDELIKDKLELAIRKARDAAEKKGLKALNERIQDLNTRHLQTNNSSFEEKVREARLLRFKGALKRFRSSYMPESILKPVNRFSSTLPSSEKSSDDDETITISMKNSDLLFAELHMSNNQNLEDEIHDILKAYYETARDEFIEYVNQLIIEPYLNSPNGPILFFSPSYVGELSESEIESLGAESASLVQERADLEATLARLNAAEAIALKYS